MDGTAYLDSLANLGVEPSLDAIEELCRELGEPQSKYRVIQVTGTNGKTTTCRAIAAILHAQGFKCGLYTSPHLVSYKERFEVDGTAITGDEMNDLLSGMRDAIDRANTRLAPRKLTQFEVLTAMAFEFFAGRQVDVAVLEVGMGARWDATSVARPQVGVVTGIDLDHTDYLGPRLEDIAAEKAYVVPRAGAAVTGVLPEAAAAIVEARAQKSGVRCYSLDRDISVAGDRGDFTVAGLFDTYGHLRIELLGGFQLANMAVAVAACELLVGHALNGAGVVAALKHLRSPGRMEIVAHKPTVVLDGAHNPQGGRALAAALAYEFPGKPVTFVLSMLADKDAHAFLAGLLPVIGAVVATTNANPRAMTPEKLSTLVREQFTGVCVTEDDMRDAVERAMELAGDDGVVCVTGSLYGIGQALASAGTMLSLGRRGSL